MKKFKIEYHLFPESENIEMIIFARNYTEAVIYAKEYRPGDSFSIEEATE